MAAHRPTFAPIVISKIPLAVAAEVLPVGPAIPVSLDYVEVAGGGAWAI